MVLQQIQQTFAIFYDFYKIHVYYSHTLFGCAMCYSPFIVDMERKKWFPTASNSKACITPQNICTFCSYFNQIYTLSSNFLKWMSHYLHFDPQLVVKISLWRLQHHWIPKWSKYQKLFHHIMTRQWHFIYKLMLNTMKKSGIQVSCKYKKETMVLQVRSKL